MIITNTKNLPEAFVSMASGEFNMPDNVYRVTQVIGALRAAILQRRHGDEITVDVEDMVWLLFGSAMHNIMEKQQIADDELREERLQVTFGDHILTGKFDSYRHDTQTVIDYKSCSVWKIIHKDFDDWRRQLLVYAYMLNKNGFPCTRGEVVAIMKDHSKTKAKREKDYPNSPVYRKRFAFTDSDFSEIEQFLNDRFALIRQIENLSDEELPLCTPEERFNSGDKYAVMKQGRKSAVRVLDSDEAALEYIADKGLDGKHYVERRPGKDVKCEDYCFAAPFCDYYTKKQVVNDDDIPF